MKKRLTIAIDGPSGAGKGTVARAIAEQLGYRHVDTGAMYRAVAWLALHADVPLDDHERVADLARRAVFELDASVWIDGHDVTNAIRTPVIDAASARVARIGAVRAALVSRQRALGRGGGIVMEGRDIGSVVFPEADVKVYLDATPEERARRRACDPAHAALGAEHDRTRVAEALEQRDHLDRTRAVSPLTRSPGSHLIDTTGVSVETVVRQVMALASEQLGDEIGRTRQSRRLR